MKPLHSLPATPVQWYPFVIQDRYEACADFCLQNSEQLPDEVFEYDAYAHHSCFRQHFNVPHHDSVWYCECDPCTANEDIHYFVPVIGNDVCPECLEGRHPR